MSHSNNRFNNHIWTLFEFVYKDSPIGNLEEIMISAFDFDNRVTSKAFVEYLESIGHVQNKSITFDFGGFDGYLDFEVYFDVRVKQKEIISGYVG